MKRSVGLRTATHAEIKQHIRDYRSQGWTVEHKTEGLPFNGVLLLTKRGK